MSSKFILCPLSERARTFSFDLGFGKHLGALAETSFGIIVFRFAQSGFPQTDRFACLGADHAEHSPSCAGVFWHTVFHAESKGLARRVVRHFIISQAKHRLGVIIISIRQTPRTVGAGQLNRFAQVSLGSGVVLQGNLLATAVGEDDNLAISMSDFAGDLESAVITLKG